MIQESVQFRKIAVIFTDRMNDQFYFDEQTCITLPKGYLPVISGKTDRNEIFTETLFINKNEAINQHVVPESIHISLFRPDSKANERIDIFKLKDINKELSSFLDTKKLYPNVDYVRISTNQWNTVYYLRHKIKILLNDDINETSLLKEMFSGYREMEEVEAGY